MESPRPTDPYAPPKADLELAPDNAHLIRRLGKLIVVKRDVPLPQRCVKCNRQGDGLRLTPRLFHYHWALTLAIVLLLLLAWPLAVVVALVGRTSARVEFSLCARHQRQRRMLAAVALFFLGLSVTVPWIGFATPAIDHDLTIAIGVASFLVGVLIAAARGQPLRIAQIKNEMLHLRGSGPEFRATFAEL